MDVTFGGSLLSELYGIEKLMNAILCPRGRSVHRINTRLAENRLGHKVLVLV